MVVCHCTAVNDALIRDSLDPFVLTVDDVTVRCGAGSQCGGCRDTIQMLLDQHRRAAAASEVAVAVG